VEHSRETDPEAIRTGQDAPSKASVAAPPSLGGERHALSPVREADEREEQERRRQLTTLGLEVALAVMLTVAARVWGWAREERARARVNRDLRRRLPAT